MRVVLLEKTSNGALETIDVREWNSDMVAALEHVNYLSLGNREYQTIEGKLNVDEGHLELLVVRMPDGGSDEAKGGDGA